MIFWSYWRNVGKQLDMFGGPVVDDAEAALERAFWKNAKFYLMGEGVPYDQAGQMLGMWRKEYAKTAVMAALYRSEAEAVSDPIPFIIGCLKQYRRTAPPNASDVERIKREALAKIGESRNATD